MSKRAQFRQAPRNQNMIYDMEHLSKQLLRNTQAPSWVFAKYAPDPFTSFFARLGITSDEETGGPGITQTSIAESVYRWRLLDDTQQAIGIVSPLSDIPNPAYYNVDYTIKLAEGWPQENATLLLEDGSTTIFLTAKLPSVGGASGYVYNFQIVSEDKPGTKVFTRRELFSQGRYVNYFGNGHPEFSERGQPLQKQRGWVDMYGIMQTIRHMTTASGHALSTNIVMDVLGETGMDIEKSYILPYGKELVEGHLEKVGMTLFYGRTNFDPVERRVRTLMTNSQRSEVPLLAGALQQFEYTERIMEYSVYGNIANTAMTLDAGFQMAANYYKQANMKYVLVTDMGGAKVLQDVMEYKAKNGIVQYRTNVGEGAYINVGNNYGKYIGAGYEWHVLNMGYASSKRGMKFEQASYNGGTYDKPSFNIYAMPIGVVDDPDGKARNSIRLISKKKDNINRALVIGNIKGMSGLHGNGTDVDLTKLDNDVIARLISEERTSVASPVDGEVVMTLSEVGCLVADSDSVLWFKPVFN